MSFTTGFIGQLCSRTKCYGLALFTDPQSLNEGLETAIYKVLLTVEVVVLAFSTTLIASLIRIVNSTSLFHRNMTRLIIFFLVHLYIYILARAALISFQERLFETTVDHSNSQFWIVVVASILRFYVLYSIVYFFTAMVIERKLATIYIKDYERRKRLRISFLLQLGVSFAGLATSCDITFSLTPFPHAFYFGIVFANASVAGIVSLLIFLYNQRRLRGIHNGIEGYSLSLRYQLEENMRAFKFLLIVAIVGVCGIAVIISIIIFRFANQESRIIVNIGGAIFDTTTATVLVSCTFGCFLSQGHWRYEFAHCLKCWLRKSPSVAPMEEYRMSVAIPRDQGSIHFDAITRLWEDSYDEFCHRKMSTIHSKSIFKYIKH